MNLLGWFVWLSGLVWLMFWKSGRAFRTLGCAYLAIFVLLALNGTSRAGYLGPAYAWVFVRIGGQERLIW